MMERASESGLTARVRRRLAELREPLAAEIERVLAGQGTAEAIGIDLGRRYARGLDALLGDLFADALEPLGGDAMGLTLAGVGGYGRGALSLGADLDVRLLTRDLERATALADALLYPLWDAGIAVGHQVVVPDELVRGAAEDLPTLTTLLDWRVVAGDPELSRELTAKAADHLFSLAALPELLARLEREVTERHRRFGGSVYLLEPDVKNGAGGLRDLDIAHWAARARWGASDLDGLVRVGALVPRQRDAVLLARERLFRIRNLLHHRARRRQDRLSFDEQEAIAAPLGYEGEVAPAVERMMSDYYRAARTISRVRDFVLDSAGALPRERTSERSLVARRLRAQNVELGGGAQLFEGEVTITHPELLEKDPALALRLVAHAVQRDVPLRASARTAITHVAGDEAWAARLRSDAESARTFVELVVTCRETRLKRGTAMRELHDLGLLLAMIPEFAPLVGRVHHDTYHVYTVDVHSVAAVDRLAEVVRGDIIITGAEEAPWAGSLACQVASDIARPRVLFFATLLHDVGKAIGRRDHSERGAELVPAILERLGFDEGEREDVARLVRQHLSMYLAATRRDLDDPATIEEFAAVVKTRECLRHLYLVTVADLSTTSPTSMTSWKARMLDELFLATDEHFRRGTLGEGTLLTKRRADALALVSGEPARREMVERFLAAMPNRYLLSALPHEVRANAELCAAHLAKGDATPTVGVLRADSGGEAVQLCVVADDRPGLLADITASIASSRLEVHAAQIHSLVIDGRALAVDVFAATHAAEGPTGVERAATRVERDLAAVARGELPASELFVRRRQRRHGRAEPHVASRVFVDNRASSRHTVVEVVTRDRLGLLFELSHALHRLDVGVSLAKIATEGRRVVDVFYVSERDGKKLAPERAREVETTLLDLIAKIEDDDAHEARP